MKHAAQSGVVSGNPRIRYAACLIGMLHVLGGCSGWGVLSGGGGGGGAAAPDSRVTSADGLAPGSDARPDSIAVDGWSGVDGGTEDLAKGDLVAGKCITTGSGGPTQDLSEQSFSASNGRSSKYHLHAAGLDMSKPLGLGVVLHGDGGSFYTNPKWGAEEMIEILRGYNMLTINVLSPDSSKSWWKNQQGSANAVFLAELIDAEVFKRYPIHRDKVLIIGYSGGADFTARYFVPEQAQESLCGGGALLFGGGSPPYGKDEGGQFSEEFKKSFDLHFYTGQNDTETMTWVKDGVDFYTKLGFTVTKEFPSGINHTNIPFADVLKSRPSPMQ